MKREFLRISILMVLLVLSVKAFSQDREIFNKISSQQYDQEWVVYLETDQVIIKTFYSDCSDPANGFYFEYLLFKVINKTSQHMVINWDWDYTYDNQPRHEESDDEISVSLRLMPSQELASSCAPGESLLKHFVRDKSNSGSKVLTSFTINNLQVQIQ